MIRVAVDAMGSDQGPEEVVTGALQAASEEIVPVVFGASGLETHGLELVEAVQEIGMEEKPSEAFRTKQESSLVLACKAVAEGQAEAVVSAGNTGAMLAAALVLLGRLSGVRRPAIAVPIPARSGPSVLIDAGANADARPEHLVQFAHMGTIFAEEILGLRRPQVRLLSIGEEPEKGNELTLEAHRLLAAEERIDFAGNAEGRDLLAHAADVVVTDGFTGNIALKLLEGTIRTVLEGVRDAATGSVRGKLGGLLIRPGLRAFRSTLDPDTYGGAYLLGLRGVVVIAHGRSSSHAIASAVKLAARGVEHGLVARLGERLAKSASVLESARLTH